MLYIENMNTESIEEQITRNLEQMYTDEMQYCKALKEAADNIIANRYNDGDWIWRIMTLFTVIYKVGKENGIREERAKKKHGKKWLY